MNRTTLLKVLNTAKPFLADQDFVPILTHFCFEKNHVLAYNDVQAIKLKLDSPLECAVPGSLLLKIFETVTKDEFTITQGGSEVLISVGKTKITLPFLKKEFFVFKMPETFDNFPIFLDLNLQTIRGLEKCLISVSSDPVNPEFTGIVWNITNNNLCLSSSDRKSISTFKQTLLNNDNKGSLKIILPKIFCEKLVLLSKELIKDDSTFRMYFSENEVVATLSPDCTIFTRNIKVTKFVDFEERLNKFIPNLARILFIDTPFDLGEVLQRAMLILSKLNLGDKRATKVTVQDKHLRFETNSVMGTSDEFVELKHPLGEFNFQIEPTLWKRACEVTQHISITPQLILTKSSDGNFLHAIAHLI